MENSQSSSNVTPIQPPVESVQPTVAPTPVPAPPKKSRTKVLVGVLILLFVVAGGVFAYDYFKPKMREDENFPTPVPQVSAEPMVDEMSGWETYTNSAYGYTIKFPETLLTQVEAAGAGVKEADAQTRSLYIYDPAKVQDPTPYIYVSIEALQLRPTFGEEWQEEQTQVNGIPSTKMSYKVGVADSDIYTFQTSNGEYLQLLITTDSEKAILANQILSTFEFVEKSQVENVESLVSKSICDNRSSSWKNFTVADTLSFKAPNYFNQIADYGGQNFDIVHPSLGKFSLMTSLIGDYVPQQVVGFDAVLKNLIDSRKNDFVTYSNYVEGEYNYIVGNGVSVIVAKNSTPSRWWMFTLISQNGDVPLTEEMS